MTTLLKAKQQPLMLASFNTALDSTLLNADWTLPSVIENLVANSDASADTSTGYSINIGSTAEGQISTTDDHDWFKVELIKDQTYSFAVIGTGASGLKDPYLTLRDANGNSVAFDDNNGPADSASITYTAQTSGIYYLDTSSAVGELGQYGISATLGKKPAFDVVMGAGALETFASWSDIVGTGTTITYGYRATDSIYNPTSFSQVSSTEMSAVDTILSLFSDVSGITFEAVNAGSYTDNATILIANYNDSTDGAGAYAYYPGSKVNDSPDGDLWLNLGGGVSTDSVPVGSWTFSTIIHELGHALGLSHPGDYNAAPGVEITYDNSSQFLQDSNQYSVMSYFDASATGGSAPGNDTGYATTPMLFDIYELQTKYGANLTTRTDNTTYGFGSTAGSVYDFTTNTTPLLCIWDAGGTDTLDCSGYAQNETIDLIQGAFSSIGGLIDNVSIALNAVIENAVGGSGTNLIIGNGSANNLTGGTNNDTINAGEGNDTLSGANGDDIIDGGTGDDIAAYLGNYSDYAINYLDTQTVSITGPDGTDTLTNIESLQFKDSTYELTNLYNNQAPTFTAFNASIGAGDENTQISLSFDDVNHVSNANDADGTITAFVVNAVTSGSLKIGTDATTATFWNAKTNATIDSTHFAYWTPANNTNGVLNAFTVLAKDDGNALSNTPIQATVTVNHINLPPVITPVPYTNTITDKLSDTDPTDPFPTDPGWPNYYKSFTPTTLADGSTLNVTLTSTVFPTYLQIIRNGSLLQHQADYATTSSYNSSISYTYHTGDKIYTTSYYGGDIGNYNLSLSGTTAVETLFTLEDTAIVLTTAMLPITDPEQSASELSYTLKTPCTNGSLSLSGTVLNTGAQFTQADINNYLIKFTPKANYNGIDHFNFSVDDGHNGVLSSQVFTLNVTAVNDAPILTKPANISYTDTVFDDTFTTFNGKLLASDVDSKALSYGISGGTSNTNGTVSLNNTYGVLTVTKATGAYTFVPNDAVIEALKTTTSATFKVTASDGVATTNQTLKLSINQPPQVITESIGNDKLTGSANNDKFDGLAGNDTISGLNGNDTIKGSAGTDSLDGGAGNDSLIGGSEIDTLIGGLGKDNLTGGTGNDIFDFNAYNEMDLGTTNRDVITDFTHGQDKVDLSTIDAKPAITGNQAFTLISATIAFSTVGQIHYKAGIISINTDTDAATEYEIQLTGVIPASMLASDFIL